MDSKQRKRLKLGAVILALAVLMLTGIWLLLSGTSEQDRVESAINELVLAVESEDVARVGASIREDYSGWMDDKATGLAVFQSALPRIESLNIRLRNVEIVLAEGDAKADVKIEWTYTMILSTGDFGKVDTSRILEESWAPATLQFVREGEGPWLLKFAETDLPQFKPKTLGGQVGGQ